MATSNLQVYKCSKCGNMTEVIHASAGELVCCGVPMELLTENTTDAALEKHVPMIETAEGGVRVKVGDVAHPMVAEHYIEWIEVVVGGKACRQFLEPGQVPEAFFAADGGSIIARAYCNLHGLWKSG